MSSLSEWSGKGTLFTPFFFRVKAVPLKSPASVAASFGRPARHCLTTSPAKVGRVFLPLHTCTAHVSLTSTYRADPGHGVRFGVLHCAVSLISHAASVRSSLSSPGRMRGKGRVREKELLVGRVLFSSRARHGARFAADNIIHTYTSLPGLRCAFRG